MSRSRCSSQTAGNRTLNLSVHPDEELEAILPTRTYESRDSSVSHVHLPQSANGERAKSNTLPQATIRPFSPRSLARALRDVAFAIFPLYFLIFAILTHLQNGKPKEDLMSISLLQMAKYVCSLTTRWQYASRKFTDAALGPDGFRHHVRCDRWPFPHLCGRSHAREGRVCGCH